MACFSGVIRSSVLSMDTGLTVILPYDRPAEEQRTPCKTLFLLHGLGDNHAAWTRYTAIETYARAKGIAVVMPEVQRSFYTDMVYGMRYFSYITTELPMLCAKMYQLSVAREDTYVAGLSMGGYGAVRCGFTYPDRYAGCASFSGVLDIVGVLQEHSNERLSDEFRAVLGTDLVVPGECDLMQLSGRYAALPPEQRPDLFLTCGKQDFLYGANRRFREHLESLDLPFTYREWDGEHVWPFWDESVRQLLDFWFPG